MEKLGKNSFICIQSNWLINNWCNVFCFKPKLFNVFCLIMVRPSKNPNSTFPIIYLASGEDCPRLFLASSLFVVPFVVIVIIIVVFFPVLVLKCWGTKHMVVTMVFLYVQCVTYSENANYLWKIVFYFSSFKSPSMLILIQKLCWFTRLPRRRNSVGEETIRTFRFFYDIAEKICESNFKNPAVLALRRTTTVCTICII